MLEPRTGLLFFYPTHRRWPSIIQTMRGVIGWLMVALSAFFVIAALGDLIGGTSGETEPGVVAGLAIFFAITGFLGYRMTTSPKPGEQSISIEQRILGLAQQMKGRVTLAEIVLNFNLRPQQAREVLKNMVQQGLAELYISDGGEEVYAFGGLMPEEKNSAKDPLD